MLISFDEISNILVKNNIHVLGSFHLGAHECEEIDFYNKFGLMIYLPILYNLLY